MESTQPEPQQMKPDIRPMVDVEVLLAYSQRLSTILFLEDQDIAGSNSFFVRTGFPLKGGIPR